MAVWGGYIHRILPSGNLFWTSGTDFLTFPIFEIMLLKKLEEEHGDGGKPSGCSSESLIRLLIVRSLIGSQG